MVQQIAKESGQKTSTAATKIAGGLRRIQRHVHPAWKVWRIPLSACCRGRIAMFHMGRCGSTVLGDLLNQHRHIFWDGEVYHRMYDGTLRELRFTRDPVSVLRWRMRKSGRRFYGFETKFLARQHLVPGLINMDLPDYLEQLRRFDFSHIIVLRRTNSLRFLTSNLVALARKQFHIAQVQKSKLTRIRIDVDDVATGTEARQIVDAFAEIDATYQRLLALLEQHHTLSLTYEDDLQSDPRVAYHRVCEFIGIEPQSVSPRLGRTNPYPLSEVIENYDDVVRALVDTPYEWMLEDS